jgi:nucleoside-diphosphate-sugar epimerase
MRGIAARALRRADLDFERAESVEGLRQVAEEGCVVLHSVPSLVGGMDRELLQGLYGKASRVVYLSTTGVYGNAENVDESTPVAPRNEREWARVATENAVLGGAWEALVLRPAAIYGPERGVHVAMRAGNYRMLGDGGNYISRVHVEDLAAVAESALLSGLTGSFPVADLRPCPAREIAEYCARLLGLAAPVESAEALVPETRRTNRRVDGRAVFERLGVTLRFPSYVEGIGQALEEEGWRGEAPARILIG